MSGAASADQPTPGTSATNANPDALEVVSGFAHDKIEGWIPELATDEDLIVALEKAFDYRGDVTITRKDGSKVEGYIFDRRKGVTLADSLVRLLPKDSNQKLSVTYAEIARLEFTGRDTASGKSWEAWIRKYWEKRAAGEKGIALKPESLD
jgi:hypothetical protein